jgi:hypothetical protein
MKTEHTFEWRQIGAGAGGSLQLPASRRTSYQFPIYRWIGWLAVAGFSIGLTVMFFISGMFGIPAPLGWAFLVIVFSLGAYLLDRPKQLLFLMLFFFMLMPKNRLLGLLAIPLPNFLDELFFIPFIAVIVMNWIQRRQLKEATLFPVAFLTIAGLSWYVNGKPSLFTGIQVTLVMLKFYILWYFCRLTSTFENSKQLARWIWAYIVYVAIQFLYNMLWQRGPWPRYHPDISGGVMGPEGQGSAHLIGYMCVFALFLLAGWWVSSGRHATHRQRGWWWALTTVIAYNLIFMTDTKHALVLMPLAFLPFLFHPSLSIRLRTGLLAGGGLFIFVSFFYFQIAAVDFRWRGYVESFKTSPKGVMFHAISTDFPYLVPYPILGAGPGRFTSNQAIAARAPLARRYIIPYDDEQRRLSHWGQSGSVIQASVLGVVRTDFFRVVGEFGWIGAATFYMFLGWLSYRLFRKSIEWPLDHLASGMFLGLSCCVIFVVFITFIFDAFTIPAVTFPLWILIGCMWDMKPDASQPKTRLQELPDGV